jgi:hypothetical protein
MLVRSPAPVDNVRRVPGIPFNVFASNEVPRFRLQCRDDEFFTRPWPGWEQNDVKAIDDRRGLYTVESDYLTLSDCDHMTIGFVKAWDIARKIRSV